MFCTVEAAPVSLQILAAHSTGGSFDLCYRMKVLIIPYNIHCKRHLVIKLQNHSVKMVVVKRFSSLSAACLPFNNCNGGSFYYKD